MTQSLNYDRNIGETEMEDFANEQAETLFAKQILNGDNFESVPMESVVSGLFAEEAEELERDEIDDEPMWGGDNFESVEMDRDDSKMEDHFGLMDLEDYPDNEFYGV